MPGAVALARETGAPLVPVRLGRRSGSGAQKRALDAPLPAPDLTRGRRSTSGSARRCTVAPDADLRRGHPRLGHGAAATAWRSCSALPEHRPRPGEWAPWYPAHLGGDALERAASFALDAMPRAAVTPTWGPGLGRTAGGRIGSTAMADQVQRVAAYAVIVPRRPDPAQPARPAGHAERAVDPARRRARPRRGPARRRGPRGPRGDRARVDGRRDRARLLRCTCPTPGARPAGRRPLAADRLRRLGAARLARAARRRGRRLDVEAAWKPLADVLDGTVPTVALVREALAAYRPHRCSGSRRTPWSRREPEPAVLLTRISPRGPPHRAVDAARRRRRARRGPRGTRWCARCAEETRPRRHGRRGARPSTTSHSAARPRRAHEDFHGVRLVFAADGARRRRAAGRRGRRHHRRGGLGPGGRHRAPAPVPVLDVVPRRSSRRAAETHASVASWSA